jgi:hypothetical protein
MNQESWEIEGAHTIIADEDGGQGNGDPAKPPGGRLILVSLSYPLLCWRSRCCAIILWEISNL